MACVGSASLSCFLSKRLSCAKVFKEELFYVADVVKILIFVGC